MREMIQGMTGFGSKEKNIAGVGGISVEIRSTNHKFLEVVQHLPEGLISLEDRIKKEIESRIKRGRLTCVVNLGRKSDPQISVNRKLLDEYVRVVGQIAKNYALKDKVKVDTLINLPGVLSVAEKNISAETLWPGLKKVLSGSLADLVLMRKKEGQALFNHLKAQVESLSKSIDFVSERFKKAIKEKAAAFATDAERTAFLKESDITEELQRIAFHARSFRQKLAISGPIGKELDFICQEMQREANTTGAKSCDIQISSRVVQIKSEIEKLREQVQNVE
jgi:uncharacterized protein (TIGR00255 family)